MVEKTPPKAKHTGRSNRLKELWSDPEYRAKQIGSRRNSFKVKEAAKRRNKSMPDVYAKTLIKARKALSLAQQRRRQPKIDFMEKALLTKNKINCINWPFTKAGIGYPTISQPPGYAYVHRLVCERVHGGAPSFTHQTLHTCDNPSCINPHHLKWGTISDNSQDMTTKRRGRNQFGSQVSFPTACSVAGCCRKYYAKGFCNMHWQQFRKE